MATRRDLYQLQEQVPRGTLVYLSPERIDPNPRQPRQQLSRTGLEELKASIAARGILQALLGVRSEQGRVTLIAGHRRWQAARELGISRVPVILVDNRSEGADPLLDAIIENVQRENLAPWEEGESYRQLAHEFGWDHKQIAASIGKSRPYVTQRIRAAENLAPAVKEFFLTGDPSALSRGAATANPETEGAAMAGVTSVTPCYELHNYAPEETAPRLAAFLNNVELVRRLTALSAARQIEAVCKAVAQARAAGNELNLADLTDILKSYRDRSPSPKARVRKVETTGYTQLSFDVSQLEVVQWSVGQAATGPENGWSAEEVSRLIGRYEQDLARLRKWQQVVG